MKSQINNIRVGGRASFVKNLLFVEGISRAGKFLMANILHGFSSVEPVQYLALLDQIPGLSANGLLHRNLAIEMLKIEVDLHTYGNLIGRHFNLRRSDKSSIYNIPGAESFLKRAEEADTEKCIREYTQNKHYAHYVVHEGLPHIDIFFEAYPHLKVIHMKRSPIELVYSWYKRGLGKRWGEDPLLFQIVLQNGEEKVPWFCSDLKQDYWENSEMDRVILSIGSLIEKNLSTLSQMSNEMRKQVLVCDYSDVVMNPQRIIQRIGQFIEREAGPDLAFILKKEGLPNTFYKKEDGTKAEFIRQHASSKQYEYLLALQKLNSEIM